MAGTGLRAETRFGILSVDNGVALKGTAEKFKTYPPFPRN
jgi:hypothetical protein